MGDAMISLRGVTKDYGRGRGIFDVTLDVERGQTVGFLGANGAGKTVTMRTLMGFIRPKAGRASIDGRDCFRERAAIQRSLGYLPGEVACPERMTGLEFLRFMSALRSGGNSEAGRAARRSQDRMNELIARFDLDPSARIGRMSKGTKQKVAIVAAFMGAPDVLLLDEPTSGLDPLMQERFVELVREEKARGATILLSSHMFPEVERTCDRVAFIRAGHVVGVRDMAEVRAVRARDYEIAFASPEECERYRRDHADGVVGRVESPDTAATVGASATALRIRVAGDVGRFVRGLADYRVADLVSHEQSLEETFLHLYGEELPAGDSVRAAASVAGAGERRERHERHGRREGKEVM